jgi:hypothetical protein
MIALLAGARRARPDSAIARAADDPGSDVLVYQPLFPTAEASIPIKQPRLRRLRARPRCRVRTISHDITLVIPVRKVKVSLDPPGAAHLRFATSATADAVGLSVGVTDPSE